MQAAGFAFTYSGDFTDNRVDGVGTVRLNTSGTLTVTGSPVTVIATIVGAGGGGAFTSKFLRCAGGGGGGNQTITVTLQPGTYDMVIGTGGAAASGSSNVVAGAGGNTIAFGATSTGGQGGTADTSPVGGVGGTPNGAQGGTALTTSVAGGSPNGGGVVSRTPQAGGDGYVELTFS